MASSAFQSFVERNQYILKQLGYMLAALLGFFLIVMLLLRIFTHHGEKRELPDYTGEFLDIAMEEAKDESFKMAVVDSIFIVGKNGGIILSQTPIAGSLVKRKRTIYVTITKSKPDEISSGRLPVLYGKSYERKSRELKNGFELSSKIVDYKFDAGPENYVLAVLYNGDTIVSATERKTDVMIEKGAVLEFVLSKSTGAQLSIPNMVCKTYSEALFLARSLNLNIRDDLQEGENKYEAFVHAQTPSFSPDSKIVMGDTILLTLKSSKPDFCVDEPEEDEDQDNEE